MKEGPGDRYHVPLSVGAQKANDARQTDSACSDFSEMGMKLEPLLGKQVPAGGFLFGAVELEESAA
jgi:hypothetical protein